MNTPDEEILTYIRSNRHAGAPDEAIREALHVAGWPVAEVDHAFAALHSPQATPEPHAQPQAAAQEYKLFTALGEAWRAVNSNLAGYVLAVLAASAIIVGCTIAAVLAGALLMTYIITESLSSLQTAGFTFIFGLIGLFVVFWIWYIFASTFLLTTVALTVDDGASGRKVGIGTILKRAVLTLKRVALAEALCGIIIFGPVLLASVLVLIYVFNTIDGASGLIASMGIMPLLVVGSLIWVLVLSLRFILVPYVALFEPSVPITATLGRSRQLMKNGGYWFVVKGALLLVLVEIILALVTKTSVGQLHSTDNWFVNLMLIFIALAANAVLVMLYRNRRAAKGK